MNKTTNEFAVLTSLSRGAVAVIRVVGDSLRVKLESHFSARNRNAMNAFAAGSLLYGDWRSDQLAAEDVVICPLTAKSAEIHCHGGSAAVEAICATLASLGFCRVSHDSLPGFMGYRPWEYEVRSALATTVTARVATLLLRQLEIHEKKFQDWQQLKLDGELDRCRSELEEALRWEAFGQHLLVPWAVVLCGEPNVGKSSLINALLGFERAIVHDTAGTTRDVVTQQTAVEGWPVEFKDTAGFRFSENPIERQGIEMAGAQVQDADLIIRVVDAVPLLNPGPSADRDWVSPLKSGLSAFIPDLADRCPDLIVVNKVDALHQDSARSEGPADRLNRIRVELQNSGVPWVETSALNGEGISQLLSAIATRLVPDIPAPDVLFPFNQRTAQILRAMMPS